MVRVVKLKQISPAYHLPNGNWRTIFYPVNDATGRRITVRSPQRLRPLPANGCEFCRYPFNRDEGKFTCPYCGKRWPRAWSRPSFPLTPRVRRRRVSRWWANWMRR